MYKIVNQPAPNRASTLITVFKKKNFFSLNYWELVERILCDTDYAPIYMDHFEAKYPVEEKIASLDFQKLRLVS
jgi:hypothetical protein